MIKNPYSKYYPGPFEVDEYGSYLLSTEGDMAFDFYGCDELLISHKKQLAVHLNSESILCPGFQGQFVIGTHPEDGYVQFSDHADGKFCAIWYKDDTLPDAAKAIMTVRGWGHLTGIGGHNLPAPEAAQIQDGFLEWAVARLNERDFPDMELEPVSLMFDEQLANAERELATREIIEKDWPRAEFPQPQQTYTLTNPYHNIWFDEPLSANQQPWYNRYAGRRRKTKSKRRK